MIRKLFSFHFMFFKLGKSLFFLTNFLYHDEANLLLTCRLLFRSFSSVYRTALSDKNLHANVRTVIRPLKFLTSSITQRNMWRLMWYLLENWSFSSYNFNVNFEVTSEINKIAVGNLKHINNNENMVCSPSFPCTEILSQIDLYILDFYLLIKL